MSAVPSALYRRPVRLDPALHRDRRISPLTDFSVTADQHSVLITATEFSQAGLEPPLLFVATGGHDERGRQGMSTIALLGLAAGENLQLGDGGRWIGRRIPARIRCHPFLTADAAGAGGLDVLVDDSGPASPRPAPCHSSTPTTGRRPADDRPAPAPQRAMDFLDRFDLEAARTRAFCERVVALDVLKEIHPPPRQPQGGAARGRPPVDRTP